MTDRNLGTHLENRYGIAVAAVAKLEEGVFRVDRHDGPPWVARVFPEARPVEQVEGDAAVLRFLETHEFPAERIADAEPFSTLDGRAVLATTFVDGVMVDGSDETGHALGALLGRLQNLPAAADGVVDRPAGSLHHWSPEGGGPEADLAAARSWLDDVAGLVTPAFRPGYDALRDLVDGTDDCHDLPHAVVHPDFHRGNVLATSDGGRVVVDWTGAGRGPRLAALGVLLSTAAAKPYPGDPPGGPDVARVDAVAAGYRREITLEPEELARLADAVRRPPLVFACFLFSGGIKASGIPGTGGPWAPRYDLADAIADRAREVLIGDR